MMRNIADLIEALRVVEAHKLDEIKIDHAPTIGSMYEGLTRELLGRCFPPSLNMNVVSGFVFDGFGKISGQIDCMIVCGEGEKIPYTDGVYKWHVKDVIAVIEIKKNMYFSELTESFDQLKSVVSVLANWIESGSGEIKFAVRETSKIYAQCVGEMAPAPSKWKDLEPEKRLILLNIFADQIGPVRIALGYNGYKNEVALRRGFATFLNSKNLQHGYGPLHIPNLIVGDRVSLIKMTGHPYISPLSSDGWWPLVGSSHDNPMLFILELIWTKISNFTSVGNIFGEDLRIERFSPLIHCRVKRDDALSRLGWAFMTTELKKKDLHSEIDEPWMPIEINEHQATLFNMLLAGERVASDDARLVERLESVGQNVDALFNSIVKTSLVARDGLNLCIISTDCMVVYSADGRILVADNADGRFERWISKNLPMS